MAGRLAKSEGGPRLSRDERATSKLTEKFASLRERFLQTKTLFTYADIMVSFYARAAFLRTSTSKMKCANNISILHLPGNIVFFTPRADRLIYSSFFPLYLTHSLSLSLSVFRVAFATRYRLAESRTKGATITGYHLHECPLHMIHLHSASTYR